MSKNKDKEPGGKTNWFFILGALIAAVIAIALAFFAGREYVAGPDEPDEGKGPEDQKDNAPD